MRIDSLKGRRALVTGSSAGIGRAIALELARHGCVVGVHARHDARVERVTHEIRRMGGTAHGLVGDLARPGIPSQLVEDFVQQAGGIDILVNCAGSVRAGPSEDVDEQEWSEAIQLMLTAPFQSSQAAARHMLSQGAGVILNISSIAGHVGLPERTAYCAAKHALVGVTRALASEWSGRGVRVASIDPAYIETGLVRDRMSTNGLARSAIERRTPVGRLGMPEEVARVAAFLASDEASYVTGGSILVDGGWATSGAL